MDNYVDNYVDNFLGGGLKKVIHRLSTGYPQSYPQVIRYVNDFKINNIILLHKQGPSYPHFGPPPTTTTVFNKKRKIKIQRRRASAKIPLEGVRGDQGFCGP